MSDNKNSGAAEQGSRLYLQEYVAKGKEELSDQIIAASSSLQSFIDSKEKVQWKSPLETSEKSDFYEYRDDFLEVLGLDKELEVTKKLRQFWPKNGPQWDGLATVRNVEGKTGLLLIEAKAHIDETKSDLRATSQESINLIEKSMADAQEYYGIKKAVWTKKFYQLGNRFAFLYFINEMLNIPAWLVLINFTGGDYKTTNKEQWLKHYYEIFSEMGIKLDNNKISYNLIQIFPEALK